MSCGANIYRTSCFQGIQNSDFRHSIAPRQVIFFHYHYKETGHIPVDGCISARSTRLAPGGSLAPESL
jgi:hypothetical protein